MLDPSTLSHKDWQAFKEHPWALHYLEACSRFAETTVARVGNYDEVTGAIDVFDEFCHDSYGCCLLPSNATTFQSVKFGHVRWQARHGRHSTTDNDYVAAFVDTNGDVHLGAINEVLRIEMPLAPPRLAIQSLTLELFHCSDGWDMISCPIAAPHSCVVTLDKDRVLATHRLQDSPMFPIVHAVRCNVARPSA